MDRIDAAPTSQARRRRTVIAVAGWIACSCLALSGFPAHRWARVTPQLRAFAALREMPKLCGVAVVGDYWTDTGGYTYLHRAVPLYIPDDDRASPRTWVPAAQAGFDTIVGPASAASALPSAYRRTTCFGDGRSCIFQRAGGCDPQAAAVHAIDRVLVRFNR